MIVVRYVQHICDAMCRAIAISSGMSTADVRYMKWSHQPVHDHSVGMFVFRVGSVTVCVGNHPIDGMFDLNFASHPRDGFLDEICRLPTVLSLQISTQRHESALKIETITVTQRRVTSLVLIVPSSLGDSNMMAQSSLVQ